MKHFIKHTSCALFSCFACLGAAAQDMSTEITVDRTIVPLEQKVAPLPSVQPSLLPSSASRTSIRLAEYVMSADFKASSGTMQTPAYTGIPAPDDYDGYVWGGYFPAYNLGLGAGYRLINTQKTLLGVAAQFDGFCYNVGEGPDEAKISDNTFGILAYLGHRFSKGLRFDFDVDYNHASVKSPLLFFDDSRSINMANVKAGIEGESGKMSYDARFVLDYLKTGMTPESSVPEYVSPSDLLYGLEGSVRYGGEKTALELGVEAMLRQRDGMLPGIHDLEPVETTLKHKNSGLYSFTPAFTLRGSGGELRLGARIDLATGTDNGSFHISPDVLFAMHPTSQLSIYALAGGGERYTTLTDQYQHTPFAAISAAAQTSFTPVDGRAGFVFGPFAGFSVELYARYAATRRAAMPMVADGAVAFMPRNLSGWGAGANISYSPARFLDLHVCGTLNPHSYASGFADVPDRAKFTLKAKAEIRPVEKLSIGIGYELRTDRCYYEPTADRTGAAAVDLGNVSDLGISASYRIISSLTVFAKVENILGQEYFDIVGVRAQKTHGLVGAMFRF